MRSFKAECLCQAAKASEGRCESECALWGRRRSKGHCRCHRRGEAARASGEFQVLVLCTAQRLRHECPVPGRETSTAAAHPLSTHILPDNHQGCGGPCWPPSGSPAQVSTWGQRQVLIGPKQSQSLLNHDQSQPCRVSLSASRPALLQWGKTETSEVSVSGCGHRSRPL